LGVGVNRLVAAIRDQGLVTVDAISNALRAGTNCGSCKPEIAALIATHAPAQENVPVSTETAA
jgi:assimilatory nitrate reductase catalytic subunit